MWKKLILLFFTSLLYFFFLFGLYHFVNAYCVGQGYQIPIFFCPGDPTIYGNLKPSPETIQSVINIIEEGLCNGYAPSVGYENARIAVAEYLSHDDADVQPKDVILCSGCSSSLEHCITVLADNNKNHNILMPRPGFPIYRTLAEAIGVSVRYVLR